jgi:hypothetical protein
MFARQCGALDASQFILFGRAAGDVEQAAAIGTDHTFGTTAPDSSHFVGDDGL